MLIPDDIKLRYAKMLFRFEHPKSDWQVAPNYRQQKQQAYYLETAAVLMNRMLADPEVRKLFATEGV